MGSFRVSRCSCVLCASLPRGASVLFFFLAFLRCTVHTAHRYGILMGFWVLYLFVSATGYLLSVLLVDPWFLLISFYLAPVLRFGSFKSFSIGICDFTFHTQDGGLHMAMGSIFYLLLTPWWVFEMLREKLRGKQ